MKTYAFRLRPGSDLRKEIDIYTKNNNIKSGVILTCVGNVKKATLRMAGGKVIKTFEDPGSYEIVSLVGTLNYGDSHMHIVISDNYGRTYGGHLKEDTIIGITAEVVIGEMPEFQFKREFDPETGYVELVVTKK